MKLQYQALFVFFWMTSGTLFVCFLTTCDWPKAVLLIAAYASSLSILVLSDLLFNEIGNEAV